MKSIIIFAFVLHLCFSQSTDKKIMGINVGGWLVSEKFITPSFWKQFNDSRVVDEWTIGQYYKDDPIKSQLLPKHWDSFVQESDFEHLSQIGFTHLRIPIGYWSLLTEQELEQHQEPFITGAWQYFVRGIQWAKKHNLQVLVDLHAAPGSQNGWDHSGHQGTIGWGLGDTVNRTVAIIDRLAQNISALENDPSTSGVIFGLELLNEPFTWNLPGGLATVQTYYLEAYAAARKHLAANRFTIVIEMAFMPDVWKDFMSGPQYENVVLDMHLYQCFSPDVLQFNSSQHFDFTCNVQSQMLKQQTLPTFVGEWSNAYKVPSDFAMNEPPPTGDQIEFVLKFNLNQMQVFSENSLGSFFWNFKTETAPMWDWFMGQTGGWNPPRLPVVLDSNNSKGNSVVQGRDMCDSSQYAVPLPPLS